MLNKGFHPSSGALQNEVPSEVPPRYPDKSHERRGRSLCFNGQKTPLAYLNMSSVILFLSLSPYQKRGNKPKDSLSDLEIMISLHSQLE